MPYDNILTLIGRDGWSNGFSKIAYKVCRAKGLHFKYLCPWFAVGLKIARHNYSDLVSVGFFGIVGFLHFPRYRTGMSSCNTRTRTEF